MYVHVYVLCVGHQKKGYITLGRGTQANYLVNYLDSKGGGGGGGKVFGQRISKGGKEFLKGGKGFLKGARGF